MTLLTKLNELDAARQKLAALEASVVTERLQALAQLPAEYGYTSVDDFIKELRAATAGASSKASKPQRQQLPVVRTKITDDLRAKVIAAVEAGKSGSQIVKEFRISLPSVQNIKKAAGLVRSRQTATADATPTAEAVATPDVTAEAAVAS